MLTLAQARKVLELSLSEYSRIRADYWAAVYDAVYEYLKSSSAVTAYSNRVKQAMITAFGATADLAWVDGGAELPMDADALSVYNAFQNAELGYIGNTFATLKLLRQEVSGKELEDAAVHQAFQRADGYASTLDSLYSQIKVMAAGAKMLTFVGEDGLENCSDCKRYKNKRHRASWWVANDAIPPNRSFECRGFRCQHLLVDDLGNIFTI